MVGGFGESYRGLLQRGVILTGLTTNSLPCKRLFNEIKSLFQVSLKTLHRVSSLETPLILHEKAPFLLA